MLHHDCFCLYHLQRIQNLLPEDHNIRVRFCERLRARLQILPDVFSRIRFNLPEMYYQQNEFALCGTGNFTPNNTVPFLTANFFNACYGLLSNNLTDRMLSRDVNSSVWQKVSGKQITYLFTECASCKMRTNAAKT
jgi:hypothetical protein